MQLANYPWSIDNGDFDRTAFYDIQVQTSLRGTENDFELGLRMMKKWDEEPPAAPVDL